MNHKMINWNGIMRFKTMPYGEPHHQSQTLYGKVVLLIGNDTAVLRALVTQMALKGADIALVCSHFSVDGLQHLQELVESLGRRFLALVVRDSSPEQLVHKVTEKLGRLDIFVDLSVQKPAEEPNGSAAARSQPDWAMTQAVLGTMAN